MVGVHEDIDSEFFTSYLGNINDMIEPAPQDGDGLRADPEPAVAGDRGTRRYVPRRLLINPAVLRRAAVVKTADFPVMSAEFGGEQFTFEPWLSLRLVQRDRIVSWAAYQPGWPLGEREAGEPLPLDVAWRRVEWDKRMDVVRVRAAPDKGAYLRSDTQIDSRIRFGRLAELPRLAAAVGKGVELLAAGVVVHAADRPDVVWDNLQVSVLADEMTMNLDYAPRMTRCGEVESWAERWSTLIDALDDEGTVPPDGDITVSYEDSFEELVACTRRFPQPVVDRHLRGGS